MTDRIPLDNLTSDQYDELCDELERLRADARQCAAQQWPQRLAEAEKAARRALKQRQEMAEERYAWQERGDRAEGAITRVRTECAALDRDLQDAEDDGMRAALTRIRHALNARPADDTTPAEPAPTATQATEPECTCGGPASTTTLPSGITYEEHRRDCTVMTGPA